MAGPRALGRGLEALLPGAGRGAPAQSPVVLPLDAVRPNPSQPRKTVDSAQLESLAESIRVHGIIQPLVVRPVGDGYEIVAGERRWKAARMAGLGEVPVRVLALDESQSVQAALVENLQREDLHPIEVADGIRDLISRFSLSHGEAARRLGWSRTAVTNKLRLLGLPDAVKALLASGTLSEGHARALLGIEDPERLLKLAEKVGKDGLSVRQAEELVQREKSHTPTARKGPSGAFPLPEALRKCSKEKGFIVAVRRRPSGLAVTLGALTERHAARLLELVLDAAGDVFREEGD